MRFGEERRAACSAIRNRLLKIAVRVRETGARIKLAFVAVAHDPGPVRRPGLKLLFTTGYSRNAVVHHRRLDPGVQITGKPFSIIELASKVRAILDSRAE